MKTEAYDPAALDDLIDRAFALDLEHPYFSQTNEFEALGGATFTITGITFTGTNPSDDVDWDTVVKGATVNLISMTIDGQDATVAFLTEIGGAIVPADEANVAIARFADGSMRYYTTDHLRAAGGPGSGNFGHAGRPGSIGGSAADGGGGIGRPISDYPPSRPDGLDTKERFSDGKGNYTPEREKLHDEIIEKMMAGKTPVDNPTATILGGAPGVGKSTIVAANGIGKDNTILVSVDNIRDELPEFAKDPVTGKQPASIDFTHEEASDISAKLIRKAGFTSHNVVLDGTGDSSIEKLGGKVAVMRTKGAKIVAEYVTTTVEMTQQRAYKRGAKIGRMVAPAVTVAMHKAVGRVFSQAVAQRLFDEFRLWDSSGQTPVLVASGTGDTMNIHNDDLWKAFQERGK